MAVLLVAGVSKLIQLSEFNASVSSWIAIPVWAQKIAVFAVPFCECAFSLMWLVGIFPRLAVYLSMCLIVSLTCVYTYQILAATPPKCECLGILTKYFSTMKSIQGHFITNGVVLGLLVFAVYKQSDRKVSDRRSVPRHRTAFTLIEVLVTLSIITVLFTLAVVAFKSVRQATSSTRSLSALRQHAMIFHQYSDDFCDFWPTADRSADFSTSGLSVIAVGGNKFEVPYFGLTSMWPLLLASSYYENSLIHPSFQVVGWPVGPVSGYHLSSSLLAHPAFWNYARRTGPSQWGATSAHQVAFPSAKVLLIRWASPPNSGGASSDIRRATVDFACIDGAAQTAGYGKLSDGYRNGEGLWPGAVNSFSRPGMHTLDGLSGRDLR